MNVSDWLWPRIAISKNVIDLFKLLLLFVIIVPDEFQYDPVSKSYGDVTRRPEVKSSTIEFIAPSEYMVCLRNHLSQLLIILILD